MALFGSVVWLLVPVGVALVATLVGRAASSPRRAPDLGDATVAPAPVGPARRLVASFVNWAATLALAIGALRLDLSFGQAVLGAPLTLFVTAAAAGAGPGELVAGTRVVEAVTGRRLRLRRVIVRAGVQLVASYAIGLAGWLAGLVVATPIMVAADVGVGALVLGIVIGTPVALVLAEPFLVGITDSRTTLWDFAARSVVVRRGAVSGA